MLAGLVRDLGHLNYCKLGFQRAGQDWSRNIGLCLRMKMKHLSPESVRVLKGAKRSKHSTVPSLFRVEPLTVDLTTETMPCLINFDQFWSIYVACWCQLDSLSFMILLPRIPCLCSSHPSTELPWSPLLHVAVSSGPWLTVRRSDIDLQMEETRVSAQSRIQKFKI